MAQWPFPKRPDLSGAAGMLTSPKPSTMDTCWAWAGAVSPWLLFIRVWILVPNACRSPTTFCHVQWATPSIIQLSRERIWAHVGLQDSVTGKDVPGISIGFSDLFCEVFISGDDISDAASPNETGRDEKGEKKPKMLGEHGICDVKWRSVFDYIVKRGWLQKKPTAQRLMEWKQQNWNQSNGQPITLYVPGNGLFAFARENDVPNTASTIM